ncbi:ribonuclease P protein component [candidate division KSB1 bacterium]|nr:ribonuclease P protein component [candidate division KSB1 bacterium]RQW06555.1 MAG: ribonuclease P protein component [candidate division KSB1 bacterium]
MILQKNADFRAIVQNGHVFKNEYFTIFSVEKDDLKVGFAAARARNKPVRNRLKRITRELWRTNQADYQLAAHIVIIANMNVMAVTHAERQRALTDLLRAIEKRGLVRPLPAAETFAASHHARKAKD